TDSSSTLKKFAQSQGVAVLSKAFLDALEKKLDTGGRLTLEEFTDNVRTYEAHKQDGDWLRLLAEAKSALVSVGSFPAFNKAMLAFRFFGGRAEVRAQYRDQAIRCAAQSAAIACIALDSA